MKKKLLTLFSFMLLSAFSLNASAQDNTALPEIEDNEMEFVMDSETGHIALVEQETFSSDTNTSPHQTTPSSYNSAYGGLNTIKATYPNTRNQNPYGTCWAFATTACAEFDMVKNHGASKSIDYSELQLAYFNYNTGSTLKGLEGDSIWIPSTSTSKSYLQVGGNLIYSMHTLAQWKTYTSESALSYQNVVNNSSYVPGSSLNQSHNAAQLRNVRYLDIKNDPDSVKQAIMDYGAVYISYGHYSSYYSLNGYSLYYCPNSYGTNHDVAIVGWNDNIPNTAWPVGSRPSSNGAWLVRNSWSTDQSVGSEYTYFYMSYEDKTLASTAYALDFEPGQMNDTLYQYDGATTHAFLNTDAIANIFTTNSSSTGYAERLDSVMLPCTRIENLNYKVEIYKNVTSDDPTSGQLVSSATTIGWTGANGIYTIDLANPVYLSPGERFAVVVTSLNGSARFEIERSSAITYYQDGVTKTWFSTTAHADAGESFLKSGSSWYDATYYGTGYGNICLKAITSKTSTKIYNINYVLDGGTNHSDNPDSFTSLQSGTITLNAPTRSGYHFCGWYKDAAFTTSATSINLAQQTDHTYYAKWCSDDNEQTLNVIKKATKTSNGSYSYKCSGCGRTTETQTAYKIASIGLSYTKTAYSGSAKSPTPVIKDSQGNKLISGTDYTYTYSKAKANRVNCGRYYVTIKFKGRYSADSVKKYFTIVPKIPASASAKLYGYDDVKVSWKKCTGASGYSVYYKKSTASSYTLYKRVTGTSVKIANLSDNVKYNFKIVPYYKASNGTRYTSLKSKIVSTTTLKKLKQPTFSVYGTSVLLTWDPAKAASGYQVYWSKSKNGKYYKLCDYDSQYTGTYFSVGKNVKYWYKTRAYRTVNGTKIFGPYSTPKAYTYK